MIGRHVIRTWSLTQPSVTLSSGEAEFYGFVKAAGAGLGHQSIMSDFGLSVPVRVWTDSSAALGISTRSGLGKLRHLETHTLWVQEKVRTGAIQVRKVRGDVNLADLFTCTASSTLPPRTSGRRARTRVQWRPGSRRGERRSPPWTTRRCDVMAAAAGRGPLPKNRDSGKLQTASGTPRARRLVSEDSEGELFSLLRYKVA